MCMIFWYFRYSKDDELAQCMHEAYPAQSYANDLAGTADLIEVPHSLEKVARGLATAHNLYNQKYSNEEDTTTERVILVVTQPNEKNVSQSVARPSLSSNLIGVYCVVFTFFNCSKGIKEAWSSFYGNIIKLKRSLPRWNRSPAGRIILRLRIIILRAKDYYSREKMTKMWLRYP